MPAVEQAAEAMRKERLRLEHELDEVRGEIVGARINPGRLVTIRLSFSALKGGHLSRAAVRKVANFVGLKLPEILTWAGGVRVVFSEEQLPAVAGSEVSRAEEAQLEALDSELQCHHEKAAKFFVALMEYAVGTEVECSIERQVAQCASATSRRDTQQSQVPPALHASDADDLPLGSLEQVTGSLLPYPDQPYIEEGPYLEEADYAAACAACCGVGGDGLPPEQPCEPAASPDDLWRFTPTPAVGATAAAAGVPPLPLERVGGAEGSSPHVPQDQLQHERSRSPEMTGTTAVVSQIDVRSAGTAP